jgi:hypothetical protein
MYLHVQKEDCQLLESVLLQATAKDCRHSRSTKSYRKRRRHQLQFVLVLKATRSSLNGRVLCILLCRPRKHLERRKRLNSPNFREDTFLVCRDKGQLMISITLPNLPNTLSTLNDKAQDIQLLRTA